VVRQLLSDGSNGTVYQADELLPGNQKRPVALKVLPVLVEGDAKAQQRFLESVKLLIALGSHPNIVSVYAMGVTEQVPWLAMEWIPLTLAAAAKDLPAAPEQVAEMMKQVANALSALHALTPPVLHNDLTPANILMDQFGGYKVTDFSLASPAAVERTRILATVRYAAPELLSGEFGPLSPATDLYALGHIAYEMALGGKLYREQFPAIYDTKGSGREGTTPRWMAWHCSLDTHCRPPHEVMPSFPRDTSMAIARLMRKVSAERYASAPALLAELRQQTPVSATPVAQGQATSAGPTPVPVAAATPPSESAVAVMDSEKRYYIRLGDRISGPFDTTAMQRLVRRGEVSRLHKVSLDRVHWLAISSIEGLF